MKDGAANDGQSVSMEEFLRGFLSLLQEGESVQFTGSRPVGTVFYVSELESKGETTESDGNAPVDSKETTDNRISIGYLASILQQFNASDNIGKQKETTEIDQAPTVGSKETTDNRISIGYLLRFCNNLMPPIISANRKKQRK
jgi:hypothetical protein